MTSNVVSYNGTPLVSLHRAIDVLEALGSSAAPLGVTELSRAVGLPKSTTHRLVHALCDRRLVDRDDGGRFRVGFALVALGMRAVDHDPVAQAARDTLRDLSARLGETVFLVVARAGELRVAEKVEGDGVMRVAPTVGGHVPVHATAAGRLFLAFAPEDVSVGPLTRFTARTPTTRAALARAVRRAGARGWDSNDGEWLEGLGVVSAPIRAPQGLYGVLAIAAPSKRLETLGVKKTATTLVDAADGIARRLGGRAA